MATNRIAARRNTNPWCSERIAQNTSISLDDHFAEFLSRKVETGRYRSASEVVREGYRRYGIGSHLIFYTVGANSVDVIRILHQRMDLTRHF